MATAPSSRTELPLYMRFSYQGINCCPFVLVICFLLRGLRSSTSLAHAVEVITSVLSRFYYRSPSFVHEFHRFGCQTIVWSLIT